MLESIKFGDIFNFNEAEYIFLGQTEDVVYAAKILEYDIASEISTMYERKQKNQANIRLESNKLYCFVILETEDFKGRMAHFGEPGNDNIEIDKTGISINQKDRLGIRDVILAEGSPVPLGLKKLVSNLDLESS